MGSLGPYQLHERLARGAMGAVYRATGPTGQVAVKLLHQDAVDPRFAREAKVVARLRHPGVVVVHDFDQDESGRQFLVMELLRGPSLKERLIQSGPFPVAEAVDLARQVCAALAYAHGQGVVHRDIKPHNLIVDEHDGRLKVVDFGLARVVDQTQSLTQTGQMVGTPAYMSPEQVLGDKAQVGPASDIYGLGATLYALLTGEPPFADRRAYGLVKAIVEERPRPPSSRRAEVSKALDAVVLRCLEKKPARRYRTMRAVEEALEAAASGKDPRPALRLAIGLVVAGASGALGLVLWRTPPGPPGLTQPSTSAPIAASFEAEAAAHDAAASKALYAQAIEAVKARDWPRARERFEEVLALDPEHAGAWQSIAELRRMEGDYAGAIEAATRSLALDPDYADSYLTRAQAAASLGDMDAALQDAAQRVQVRPDEAFGWETRGRLLFQAGQLREAERSLSEAIRIQPESKEGWKLRGQVRLYLLDTAGALDDFERALQLDPDDVAALSFRGFLRAAEGDADGGLSDLERSIELDPEVPAAWDNLGQVRLQLGRYAAAREAFSRAIELDPNPLSYLGRAEAQRQLGAKAEAAADARRVLELNPDDAQKLAHARQLLAELER